MEWPPPAKTAEVLPSEGGQLPAPAVVFHDQTRPEQKGLDNVADGTCRQPGPGVYQDVRAFSTGAVRGEK